MPQDLSSGQFCNFLAKFDTEYGPHKKRHYRAMRGGSLRVVNMARMSRVVVRLAPQTMASKSGVWGTLISCTVTSVATMWMRISSLRPRLRRAVCRAR